MKHFISGRRRWGGCMVGDGGKKEIVGWRWEDDWNYEHG